MSKTSSGKAGRQLRVRRVVGAQMKIYEDGTASFHVRGYDFRWADIPIAVNGYLFAPVRPNDADLRQAADNAASNVK